MQIPNLFEDFLIFFVIAKSDFEHIFANHDKFD